MDVINVTNSVTLGALAGILFGGAVGLVNGLIVTRLKVNSLIATIGTMMILQGSVFLYSREAVQNHHHLPVLRRHRRRLCRPGADPGDHRRGGVRRLPTFSSATPRSAAISTPSAPTPRRRGSPACAREQIKLFAFVVTGLLVGVAGLILASLMNAGQPTAGRGFELVVVAAVILGGTSLSGGRGTLLGTLLGVLVLKVIDNGIIMLQWSQDLQMVVPGVVLDHRHLSRPRAEARRCRLTPPSPSRRERGSCARNDRDRASASRAWSRWRTSISVSSPARSTPSWARTAPASRR